MVFDFTGNNECSIRAVDTVSISQYNVPYIIIEVKNFSDDTLFVWTRSGYIEKWDGNVYLPISDTLYGTYLTEGLLRRVLPRMKYTLLQDIAAASSLSGCWDEYINRPRLPPGKYRINIRYGITKNQPPDDDCYEFVQVESELNVVEVSETCKTTISEIRDLFKSRSQDSLARQYLSHKENIPDCAAEYYFLAIRRAWLLAERKSSEVKNFMRRVGNDVIRKIPESYAAVFFQKNLNIAENIETNNSDFIREREERNRFIDSLGERNMLRRVSKKERIE